MKFKFHWGWAIAIFYSSFVAVMIYFVIYSKTVDHSLVRDNYYDYDIGYENLIGEKRRNSNSLKTPVNFKVNKETDKIIISFPQNIKNITGEVWLYRVNNEKLDTKSSIKLNSQNQHIIDISKFAKGKWKINVDWKSNEKRYLDSQDIYLR